MRDLVALLDTSQLNTVTYGVATVTAIQASAGTVTLAMGIRSLGNVPYLLSYSPTVNDKIHMLISESTGMLVLGKSLAVAAPVAPTQRTAFLVPNRSMTWSEERATAVGFATDGQVSQGGDAMYIRSGAYSYATGQVTLVAKETIIYAELLIARVDDVHSVSASPCLMELQNYDANGRPTLNKLQFFMPADMAPGDVIWAPIPVTWAKNIVTNATKGVGFYPVSAQQAFVVSRYAPYNQVVFSTYTAGTIRLTIQKAP